MISLPFMFIDVVKIALIWFPLFAFLQHHIKLPPVNFSVSMEKTKLLYNLDARIFLINFLGVDGLHSTIQKLIVNY